MIGFPGMFMAAFILCAVFTTAAVLADLLERSQHDDYDDC